MRDNDPDPDPKDEYVELRINAGADGRAFITFNESTPYTGLDGVTYKKGDLSPTWAYMKDALEILEPALLEGQTRDVDGRVVLGTVEGDLHEIGKTLVGTMLTANGFAVKDIGIDQSPAMFVEAAKEFNADIVGASALLTTTMLQQEKIIQALDEDGLRKKVKVMIGGAPITKAYADQIGADGYAEDAISAVDLAYRLMDAPV